ncbi:zinc finger BED domain-containing protein 4-like [Aplysia californica]|uniref:Zinc finger BED domain-containing protein 4-like n=1 Tax=Aplysia californica TaxID=6500 RepID=A0ABM0JG95_APLCA|nr:zinc finger BED domain-containing protein 4-like [Aplysia californica]
MSAKPSLCWKLITQKSGGVGGAKIAVCDVCKCELAYSGRSTTNLLRHLRKKHPLHIAQFEEVSESSSTTSVPAAASSSTTQSSAPTAGPSRSTQPTLFDTIERVTKYKPGSDRKKELDNCVLDLVTVDLQPLSVVENTGFRRLVNKLDPRYDIVSRKTLSTQLLPMKYRAERDQLRRQMDEVNHLTVTTDCWTSRKTESFMTVTVHFVSPDWKLTSRVLNTVLLETTHTSENLAAKILEIFTAWGIKDKVTTIVTDNAANMKLAVELMRCRHQPCFAHTLNLVVKESIRKTYDVFTAKNKVKDIVSFFHHSVNASNLLKEAHKAKNTTPKKLKQDVETRWNSTFEMLKSYLEQHEQVTTALCLNGKQDMCLSPIKLPVLQKAMEVLEPFHEATVEISTEQHTSVAKIVPIVFLLRRLTAQDRSPLSNCLNSQLSQRFENIDEKTHLRLATLLDPRFKRDGFPTTASANSAVDKLKTTAMPIALPQQPGQIQTTASKEETTAPPPAKKVSKLWTQFDQAVKGKQAAVPRVAGVESEIRRYLDSDMMPRDSNPLTC